MGALDGIVVIDRSRGPAGSICTLELADAGADVIKVEPLTGGPPGNSESSAAEEGYLLRLLNRDKQSIALNTATAGGRDVLLRLIAQADALVEDSGLCSHQREEPLAWGELKKLNERLVYCSISPWGEGGSAPDDCPTELEIQGLTGHMAFLGTWGRPPVRCGADIAYFAGGMHAFIGVVAALHSRMVSGKGQRIDVSTVTALLSIGSHWLADFSNPDEFVSGLAEHLGEPQLGYRCSDRNVAFGFFGRRFDKEEPWEKLCAALGMDALLEDEWMSKYGAGYVGSGQDAEVLKPLIEEATGRLPSDEVMRIVEEVGGAGAPILSYEDLFGDPLHPQVAATGAIITLQDQGQTERVVLSPWAMDGEIGRREHRPAPALGADTRQILHRFGFGTREVQALRQAGVIA